MEPRYSYCKYTWTSTHQATMNESHVFSETNTQPATQPISQSPTAKSESGGSSRNGKSGEHLPVPRKIYAYQLKDAAGEVSKHIIPDLYFNGGITAIGALYDKEKENPDGAAYCREKLQARVLSDNDYKPGKGRQLEILAGAMTRLLNRVRSGSYIELDVPSNCTIVGTTLDVIVHSSYQPFPSIKIAAAPKVSEIYYDAPTNPKVALVRKSQPRTNAKGVNGDDDADADESEAEGEDEVSGEVAWEEDDDSYHYKPGVVVSRHLPYAYSTRPLSECKQKPDEKVEFYNVIADHPENFMLWLRARPTGCAYQHTLKATLMVPVMTNLYANSTSLIFTGDRALKIKSHHPAATTRSMKFTIDKKYYDAEACRNATLTVVQPYSTGRSSVVPAEVNNSTNMNGTFAVHQVDPAPQERDQELGGLQTRSMWTLLGLRGASNESCQFLAPIKDSTDAPIPEVDQQIEIQVEASYVGFGTQHVSSQSVPPITHQVHSWQERVKNYTTWAKAPLAWRLADVAVLNERCSRRLVSYRPTRVIWKQFDDPQTLKEGCQLDVSATFTAELHYALHVNQEERSIILPLFPALYNGWLAGTRNEFILQASSEPDDLHRISHYCKIDKFERIGAFVRPQPERREASSRASPQEPENTVASGSVTDEPQNIENLFDIDYDEPKSALLFREKEAQQLSRSDEEAAYKVTFNSTLCRFLDKGLSRPLQLRFSIHMSRAWGRKADLDPTSLEYVVLPRLPLSRRQKKRREKVMNSKEIEEWRKPEKGGNVTVLQQEGIFTNALSNLYHDWQQSKHAVVFDLKLEDLTIDQVFPAILRKRAAAEAARKARGPLRLTKARAEFLQTPLNGETLTMIFPQLLHPEFCPFNATISRFALKMVPSRPSSFAWASTRSPLPVSFTADLDGTLTIHDIPFTQQMLEWHDAGSSIVPPEWLRDFEQATQKGVRPNTEMGLWFILEIPEACVFAPPTKVISLWPHVDQPVPNQPLKKDKEKDTEKKEPAAEPQTTQSGVSPATFIAIFPPFSIIVLLTIINRAL